MYQKKKNECFSNIYTGIFVLVVLAILVFSTKVKSADDRTVKIEETRVALEEYIETQRQISKERHGFELSQEMLKSRMELLKEQIRDYRKKIEQARTEITKADEERASLADKEEQFQDSSERLKAIVVGLEERTKKLLKRLPGPIRDQVKVLSQSLPDNQADTGEKVKQTTLQRFQNVAGILNSINKYNSDISVESDMLDLGDDAKFNVSCVYVGLGQAYYSNSDGTIGGIGVSTSEGIKWKQDNDIAPQVFNIVKILDGKEVASFVQLPVDVKKVEK